LYQERGISLSGSRILVSFIVPPWNSRRPSRAVGYPSAVSVPDLSEDS
jgi:hypothetical protein